MTTNPDTFHAGINTLTIDGVLITKDIAKQLDELRFQDWENFAPLGRVRTGRDYGDPGIELLGTSKSTGALVRMWHVTKPMWCPRFDGSKFLPPVGDGLDDLRQTLTDEYNGLPLIVLPKDGRA